MQIRIRLSILMQIQIQIRILPQVLHMTENEKIFGGLLFTAVLSLYCFIFLVNVIGVIIINIFLTIKFSGKKYRLASAKMMSNLTDTYPEHWV